MTSLYTYTDYRAYLRDRYEWEKQKRPSFSYQYLARRAGFASKSFVHKIMTGEKSLTVDSALKLAGALDLSLREKEYFQALVLFNNARSSDERTLHFRTLQRCSRPHEASVLRKRQFDYFAHWYNNIIRELAVLDTWDGDFRRLAAMVNPPITAGQAENAVKLLCDLELLEPNGTGGYRQTAQAITTGDDVRSLAVSHYQKEMMNRARESLDRFPREERDISTLTFSISAAGMREITDELAQARRRIIEIITRDTPVDRVCQLNLQLFPVSQIPLTPTGTVRDA